MRNKFDEQLELLNSELTKMGALVESAIALAVKALENQDIKLAEKAIAFDSEVDQKEKDIERLCLKLLLQQQPVARDLRQISSALKMITDMERIGDQAADISEITITGQTGYYVAEIANIPEMAEATIHMVNDSVDAFVHKDIALAYKVIRDDDKVDTLFDQIKKDLVQLLRNNEASESAAMDLLMVAKYFERIGDHATNIAEWVAFSITGKHKTM